MRAPQAKDIPDIVRYASHTSVAEMTLNIPHPYVEKDAIFWLNMAQQGFAERKHFIFAMEEKVTGVFARGIGLMITRPHNRAEAGYWIGQPFRNRGYTTEAFGQLLKFGFEQLKLHKVLAAHLLKNPASGKVMIKNGMIREAELVEHVKKGKEYMTLIQYRLTKGEYENLQVG